jgi:hypothetical protein
MESQRPRRGWSWAPATFSSGERGVPLADPRVVLLSILLPLAVQPIAVQAGLDERPTAAVVTIEASQDEVLRGYLQWLHRHPEVMRHVQPLIPVSPPGLSSHESEAAHAVEPLLIGTPSIDLYSPLGISIYHGTDSDKNAAFIRALPRSIQQGSATKISEVRPTLQEAMEMFAELEPYVGPSLGKTEYTIFALTYADRPYCKTQNEAVEQLKTRARGIGIRVIEVRLSK